MTNELTLKVFIEDLAEVNKGNMVGRWYDLTDAKELQAAVDFIGSVEEHYISDYESEIFDVWEHETVDELKELAKVYGFVKESVEEFGVEAVKEVVSWIDIQDAESYVIATEHLIKVEPHVRDYEYALGVHVYDEYIEDTSADGIISRYFDYEKYGRDLILSGDFTYLGMHDDMFIFSDANML